MVEILTTRWFHWKKQIFSLLFWLLFPIIGTLVLLQVLNTLQEDSKIPVGIVMEDESHLAEELYQSIKQTPFIRIDELTEIEAKQMVQNHKLDSAFIIEENYEKEIIKGNRNWLITAYSSNLSFAYQPVKEMIVSYVQEDTGRSKAAAAIYAINEEAKSNWTLQEIITKTKEIQLRENLLRTTFSINGKGKGDSTTNIWSIWGIWAILTILSTFFLFDWVIKGQQSATRLRFTFMKYSWKGFLLRNLLLHTILFYLFDIVASILFYIFVQENLTWKLLFFIFLYRVMVNLAAFLIALLFNKLYVYYSVSFIITMIVTIISGAILPMDRIIKHFPWIEAINPFQSFLEKNWGNPWLILFIIWMIIWLIKGGKPYVKN
ncbi:ABC transporter permease [Oceanobacillus senegalensis]|uniref:ABC transporter permease n=1 Tax=Oceanobacillus senegalensis TaxID=1936063 RepID=UPI0015C4C820|nr:ABC transporter permease [Oceanobacillus senegalensis]